MAGQVDRSGSKPTEDDNQFWQNLQVYPAAIGRPETKEIYTSRALDVISGLPRSNIIYLFERLGVAYDTSEDLTQPLAWRLMHSEHARLLTYLAAYLRPRISYVVDFFDKQFPDSESQRIQAEVTAKSRGGRDTVKPFTKLLCIYLTSPSFLELIHYNYAWRRMPTFAEFEFSGGIPSGAAGMLGQAINKLLKTLGEIKSGEGFSFFGSKLLRPGLDVFVMHRDYQAAVKPDYRDKFRLQHDYSQIVFGLNEDRSALVVRIGNKAITESISNWVRETLDVELTISGGSLFTDYDSDRVSRSFMGAYDELSRLDLVGIEFRHTTLPGGSPMTLAATEFNRSIREELRWLREREILRLTSLADIKSATVKYKGIPSKVECRIETGGAVSFHLIDTGLDEDHVKELEAAFLEAFHVPIGQMIDPTKMMMGATEIYHHLLSGVEDEQIHRYQREHLHRLIEWGVLKIVVTKTGKRVHINCVSNSQQFTDDNLVECPSCQNPLKWDEHKRYKLNSKAVAKVTKALLQAATGRTLSSTPHKFESHSVYRLYSKKNPSKFVHVFFNEYLSSEKIELFQRAMFPIMIVHPTGTQRAPVIDGDGIAHVGFPHALAANDDTVAKQEFRKATRTVIRRMMQMEQERILKAARHSRDSLCNKIEGYNDRMFESDVYNLMRRMFPHSIKLGGVNKPDGFSSLVFFEGGDLSVPTKVNLSYDAKYSDSTYDFGIGEQRQMHEYIKSLSRSKQLQREMNHYDGHMIIFNSIKQSAMEGAANYLWNIDRLPKLRENFLLIFMHEGFLTTAWDLIHDQSAEISKRWYAFPEAVVTAMKALNQDGYTLLDESAATDVVTSVLRQPASENPINHESLLQDLKEHVGQRTNRSAKRDKTAASN